MSNAISKKFIAFVGRGSVIYPGAVIENPQAVSSATRQRYKRQSLIYKDPAGHLCLTEHGARTLGWQPPKPSLLQRTLRSLGIVRRPART